MTDTRDVAETETIKLAHALYTRLAAIEEFTAHNLPDMRGRILTAAAYHVGILAAREDNTDVTTAAQLVCRALFGDTDIPEEFWATKLGRDVAWAIGYPWELVPVAQAQAVLGVSRSYLRRLMRENVLAFIADHIYADSLRDYARRTPAANRGGNTTARW